MRSESFLPLQRMWLSSTRNTQYLFIDLEQLRFHESPLQLLQKPRASPREPCVLSSNLSGRSEIDFAASLLTLVQIL
ncbi:hypothetical protein CDL15_Pgr009144 [Punica granatum]|uniref:Uncharacterized protein n=1 Tax=Punica granatum TaxID=22663 RepID=A0A218WIN2_PUNGR|nr:hypothetical protein CDL15_Pgr009144 [Punica granatum]